MKALTKLGFIEGDVFFTYELENGGFMLITKATGNIYFREASQDCLMQLSVFSSVEQVGYLLMALEDSPVDKKKKAKKKSLMTRIKNIFQ